MAQSKASLVQMHGALLCKPAMPTGVHNVHPGNPQTYLCEKSYAAVTIRPAILVTTMPGDPQNEDMHAMALEDYVCMSTMQLELAVAHQRSRIHF